MMDPKVKADWVKALRSGYYKQGKQYLEYDGCNCCLGVLCRITDTPSHQMKKDGSIYFEFGENRTSDCVPTIGFYGLSDNEISTLWHMNDRRGKTFAEIADYIENNPEI